jgi:hypothetical protein
MSVARSNAKPVELREAIAAHARAVLASDAAAAERFVTPAALDGYRTAIEAAAQCGPFESYTAPALARLGTHYIARLRLTGPRGSALMQIRWKREADANWRIAEAEYFPPGRSPWSGVGRPRPAALIGKANV